MSCNDYCVYFRHCHWLIYFIQFVAVVVVINIVVTLWSLLSLVLLSRWAILDHNLGTGGAFCPSVRPSVTSWYHVKMNAPTIMRFSLPHSTGTLVWDQLSCCRFYDSRRIPFHGFQMRLLWVKMAKKQGIFYQ